MTQASCGFAQYNECTCTYVLLVRTIFQPSMYLSFLNKSRGFSSPAPPPPPAVGKQMLPESQTDLLSLSFPCAVYVVYGSIVEHPACQKLLFFILGRSSHSCVIHVKDVGLHQIWTATTTATTTATKENISYKQQLQQHQRQLQQKGTCKAISATAKSTATAAAAMAQMSKQYLCM